MSDRGHNLLIFAILTLLILGMMGLLFPMVNNNLKNDRPAGPTLDIDAAVNGRLTEIAWAANRAATATQEVRIALGQALNATAYAEQTLETGRVMALTATVALQLTQTVAVKLALTATAIPRLTETALVNQAQQTTGQALTATVGVLGTAMAKANADAQATTAARATINAAREGALTGSEALTTGNARRLYPVVSLQHPGPVDKVLFSPDGSQLATTNEGLITLWSVKTGAVLSTLQHGIQVNDLTFNPDGSLLVSATSDGTVWLWDTTTGTLRASLKAHNDTVFHVAFSPDGSLFASAGADKTVIWDTATGLPLTSLASGWAWNVTFSPGGRYVVTASGDGIVRVWGVPVREPTPTRTATPG
jgi:hypothetical protein